MATTTFEVPIVTTQKRDVDAIPADERSLPYDLELHTSKQSVTNGRLLATPALALKSYKFDALLDWIAIAVTFPKKNATTKIGRAIKSRLNQPTLGGVKVEPLKRGGDRYTREMKLTMQDPTLPRLSKVLDLLACRYGVPIEDGRAEHRVLGFELSVDIYPRASMVKDDLDLALRRVQMSELLRKHFAPQQIFANGEFNDQRDWLRCHDGEGRHLISWRKGERRKKALEEVPKLLIAATDPAKHFAAPVNATVYLGKRGRPMNYKLQDKVADQRDKEGKPRKELAPRERRSRIEVTLESKTLDTTSDLSQDHS
ncbi:MAG: hypothetical protein HWE39_19765 [Oceanospirillaceae bacterium]|uniref:hypothetical protein n=1 Tax=Salipiger sp. HF18 TaxID=2721557 RepID=UPI00142DF524|nr:hypothetical protein [Salipiger sp. HF18]NIY95449.1 hypothetical protein [Salipiger sp. HF18]NVK43488.1 hypothetical protein [Oceanospirillaceae bacterium]